MEHNAEQGQEENAETVEVPKFVEQTSKPYDDPFVNRLNKVIDVSVRIMAIMMTVVIVFGVIDVGTTIFEKLTADPFMRIKVSDFLSIFGAFMGVLIAMEIFVNITIYLREDVIHVNIVLATALMAVARKVITLDFKETTPDFIYGTALLVAAMSVGYWLVVVRDRTNALKAADLIEDKNQ